jgi:hypothetical protein
MNDDALLKANTASAVIKMVTGFEPLIIEKQGGGAFVTFADTDRKKVTALIETTAKNAIKAPPGDVTLDIFPVVTPLLFKYLLPAVVVLVLIGAIGGYTLGHSK